MKTVSCAIWILCALLVIVTLDVVPDPPAVTPNAAVGKVLQLQDYSCPTATRGQDSVVTHYPFPESLIAADACEPYRPSDRIVLTRHAADPSPPSQA